ncbi:MAG: hypothetical protein RMJ43_16430 [Chloroherpetonaceae bacterium]|nr:hypothetical protein [Chthonomonadaceae bacterium]MDW8209417.1 hypothetical protein [Chloroherpetonaceae bacterium]
MHRGEHVRSVNGQRGSLIVCLVGYRPDCGQTASRFRGDEHEVARHRDGTRSYLCDGSETGRPVPFGGAALARPVLARSTGVGMNDAILEQTGAT